MINTDKMNKLMREVEDLMREHSTAVSLREEIKKQVGLRVLSGEEFELEEFKRNLADTELTIRWTKERLDEVKTEMTSMIDAIRFWDAS